MKNAGGRVDITLNGRVYHPVAAVKINGAKVEIDIVDNQDGTSARSIKSTHYEVELTFRDMDGLDVEELMMSEFDFSMIERDRGRSILLTNAGVAGKPMRDTVTGEVSGLKIASSQYRVV